jgi:hypothetical protein
VPETKAKTVNTIYHEIVAGQVWRRHNRRVYIDNKVEPNNKSKLPAIDDEIIT